MTGLQLSMSLKESTVVEALEECFSRKTTSQWWKSPHCVIYYTGHACGKDGDWPLIDNKGRRTWMSFDRIMKIWEENVSNEHVIYTS